MHRAKAVKILDEAKFMRLCIISLYELVAAVLFERKPAGLKIQNCNVLHRLIQAVT